jgi:hypothetical protein
VNKERVFDFWDEMARTASAANYPQSYDFIVAAQTRLGMSDRRALGELWKQYERERLGRTPIVPPGSEAIKEAIKSVLRLALVQEQVQGSERASELEFGGGGTYKLALEKLDRETRALSKQIHDMDLRTIPELKNKYHVLADRLKRAGEKGLADLAKRKGDLVYDAADGTNITRSKLDTAAGLR